MTRTYGKLVFAEASAFGRAAWGIRAEPHVAVKLKRWFPRAWSGQAGALMLIDTPEVASDLRWLLERWPLEMDPDVAARLESRAGEYAQSREVALRILDGGQALTGEHWLEPALPPKGPWQLVPADLVLSLGRVFCGDVLGMGKTFEGLMVLRDPNARPAVVVCPPHLQRQWIRELGKFFPTLRGHIIRSTKIYDLARVRGAHGHDPDVVVISYSKLASWQHHLIEAMQAGRMRTVIFDEAHELRRPESQKYAAARAIADAAKFKMQMSGTPVFNYGGDVHTILRLIDGEALGTREEFVREWGKELGRGKVGVRDPRALGFYLRDQALLVRRTPKDVGEDVLPPERIPHEVDVDQRTLDGLLDEGGAVELAELISTGAGTREEVFKARGDLDWQMRRATGVAKAPYVAAFVRLLLESTPKVVLWGWHRDVYEVWLRKLAEFNPVLYTGSESPRQKELSAARFVGGEHLERLNEEDRRAGRLKAYEQHPESQILIMSLRSGAGLDGLQAVCNVSVFGELDWSPAQHDQCEGRLDRAGQTERVLSYFLHAPDGSDPVVMEVLGMKRKEGELIRDPSLPLLERGNDTTDRVMRLAEDVLSKRRTHRSVAA